MNSKVLVVGSINMDDAFRVDYLPHPGETIAAHSNRRGVGGKGANQAIAATQAGAKVLLVGAVGGSDGTHLRHEIANAGVDVEGVEVLEGTPTGRAVVLIDDDAENSIVILAGANAEIPAETVIRHCSALQAGDVVLLQHEIPAELSRLAARKARSAGASVIWNAAPAPTRVEDLVDDVDVLMVNETELAAVAALLKIDTTTTSDLLREVSRTLSAGVICTLGDAGAAWCINGASGTTEARRVKAIDTTAAGDTFAGFYAALWHLPQGKRLRIALDAASLAVTRPGAADSIPSLAEVDLLGTRLMERFPQ